MIRVIVLAMASSLALACAEDKPVSAPASDRVAAIREACALLAEAWCSSHELCLAATFDSAYGDLGTCVSRQALLCERTRFGEGSTARPEDVRRCAEAWDLSSYDLPYRCQTWLRGEFERKPPDACRTPGELTDGNPCLMHDQCEHGVCARVLACGVCRTPSDEEPCFEDAQCPPGKACRNSRCVIYGDEGAPCDAMRPCHVDLWCNEAGQCSARLPDKSPCDADAPNSCALFPTELACGRSARLPFSEPGRCAPYELVAPSKPCGVKLDGTTALCEHGSVCRAHVKNGSIVSASCDPVIDDGLSCGTNTGFTGLKFPYGGPCRAPAVCSEHVCDLPSTTACGAPPLP